MQCSLPTTLQNYYTNVDDRYIDLDQAETGPIFTFNSLLITFQIWLGHKNETDRFMIIFAYLEAEISG